MTPLRRDGLAPTRARSWPTEIAPRLYRAAVPTSRETTGPKRTDPAQRPSREAATLETATPHAPSLDELVAAVRDHAGLRAKGAIGAVRRVVEISDPVTGPGDDGAVVEMAAGGSVVVCGEAMHPAFVASDPRAAGMAAVLANVNDLAAMGAVPRAIVNTVVATGAAATEALGGMAEAARLYGVPIVGGHITEHGGEPALSAFAVGDADRVLSVSRARAGQHLVFAGCVDGRMRTGFDFFTSIGARGPRLAADVRLLARAARDDLASAAKDVSMAGSIGSLAMLLEPSKLGADIDLDKLPTPAGVSLDRWLTCFPTYAFWLTTDHPEQCVDLFRSAGLAAAAAGTVTDRGVLTVQHRYESRKVFDLEREPITGLW